MRCAARAAARLSIGTLDAIRNMKIRVFQPIDETAVVALWQESGLTRPWNDPRADIARKLTEQPEMFLGGTFRFELMVQSVAAEMTRRRPQIFA